MQRNRFGFTLIEVLVVVAVTAVLALIITSIFIERLKRTRVAVTKSDMRKLAMAIDAYLIDSSSQPAWGIGHPGPDAVRTWNWDVASQTGNPSGVADLPSFLLNDRSTPGACFDTLTSATGFISTKGMQFESPEEREAYIAQAAAAARIKPGEHFAYIDSYPVDPFCADYGATFVYWAVFPGDRTLGLLGNETAFGVGGVGWITVSPGPDGDYDLPGSYHAYNPAISQSSPFLLAGTNAKGASFTYDPTNGLDGNGDIWRVKQ